MLRITATIVLLALLLACLGCKTSDTYWSFPTSRWLLEDTRDSTEKGDYSWRVLPLAVFFCVDIVLLPITIFHDLWLMIAKDSGHHALNLNFEEAVSSSNRKCNLTPRCTGRLGLSRPQRPVRARGACCPSRR